MSAHKDPETAGTARGKDGTPPDVVSDPAQSTEQDSSDWTDEAARHHQDLQPIPTRTDASTHPGFTLVIDTFHRVEQGRP